MIWLVAGILVGATLALVAVALIPEFAQEVAKQGERFVSRIGTDGVGMPLVTQPTVSPKSVALDNAMEAATTVQPPRTTIGVPAESQVISSVPATEATLESLLPRDVFEEFQDNFYGNCSEPAFDDLKVFESWSGEGNKQIDFVPPPGTYFLALVGSPSDSTWRFDSVLESSRGKRFQSLQIDSSVQDELTDAQEWCSSGFGLSLPSALNIVSTNIAWTVYLVTTDGSENLPRPVAGALTGYYGVCPSVPSLASLEATQLGEGTSSGSLEFGALPPYYFLAVKFEPDSAEWYFRSVDVSGNQKSAGPKLSSDSGETIDFTATCPSSSGSYHLEIDAAGGQWIVYLITVSG